MDNNTHSLVLSEPQQHVEVELAVELTKYIREKHTQEECIGFSAGFRKAFELLSSNAAPTQIEGELSECLNEAETHLTIPFEPEIALNWIRQAKALTPKVQQQEWVRVEDRTPIATEKGNWDGERSQLVLTIDEKGKHSIARVYEGCMDGHKFSEWYDERDFDIETPLYWMPLPDLYTTPYFNTPSPSASPDK